tara:strand:- start:239 stop:676 length:438 start_codon:yes stop_codon:yes gene_type:complete
MIKFKAAYNRQGAIWLEQSHCCSCNEISLCINIDSSEGEYGAGSICQECLVQLQIDYANGSLVGTLAFTRDGREYDNSYVKSYDKTKKLYNLISSHKKEYSISSHRLLESFYFYIEGEEVFLNELEDIIRLYPQFEFLKIINEER